MEIFKPGQRVYYTRHFHSEAVPADGNATVIKYMKDTRPRYMLRFDVPDANGRTDFKKDVNCCYLVKNGRLVRPMRCQDGKDIESIAELATKNEYMDPRYAEKYFSASWKNSAGQTVFTKPTKGKDIKAFVERMPAGSEIVVKRLF